MFRPLAVNIGLRYARSRRSFISFVTGLSLAGLALSVAVLVFVQAVVAGFEREMNDRVLAMVPHVTLAGNAPVFDYADVVERIRGVEGVVGISPVVRGGGLLKHGERLTGVRLTGVDPGSYPAVSRVFEFVQGGDEVDLPAGGFHVILGVGVAERLGAVVGDEISVVLPATTATPLGVFARQKKLRVSGVLDTHSMLDRSSAFLHRTDAARLFRLGSGVHGFEVAVERPLQAEAVRARIRRALVDDWHALGLPALWDSSWVGTFGNLHTAIQTTKNMLFLLLSLLVAVAAFNLVSSLVMIVNERRGDIAILRTMGSHSVLVVGVFRGRRDRHRRGRGRHRHRRRPRPRHHCRGRIPLARAVARYQAHGRIPDHDLAGGLRLRGRRPRRRDGAGVGFGGDPRARLACRPFAAGGGVAA